MHRVGESEEVEDAQLSKRAGTVLMVGCWNGDRPGGIQLKDSQARAGRAHDECMS